jgi:hypothetical protein
MTAIPFALETLEIYTMANIQKNIKGLDEEMRKLGVYKKLGKNLSLLKDLFVQVKRELGPYPSIDLLWARIREILLRMSLKEIVNEDAFRNLVMRVNEEKAYDILAWGIIMSYLKMEARYVPHPSIHIIYDD